MSLYFIALIPPEKIRLKIRSFKEEIKEKYGVKHALKLPAHITLQKPFKMVDAREQELIPVLKNFSEGFEPFQIEISGFGRFDKRAVLVDVQTKEPVKSLFEHLQQVVLPFVSSKDRQCEIHPHLTVATRDLNRDNFVKVWQDLKEREYAASFEASGLHLLKHYGKTWDTLAETTFGAK
jgi:2'-5' RNA ligase